MPTITASHEAKLSLHRIAMARTRAIHNNDRLYRAVVEVMEADRSEMKITPREELKRKS